MTMIPAKELFDTDWKDKDAVIRLAKRMGKNQSVIKYFGRQNYNITHTSTLNAESVKRHGPFYIVYQTARR